MPTTPTRPKPDGAERIQIGDRVAIRTPGQDAFHATVTDFGGIGPTLRVGTKLLFLPWAAIAQVERLERCDAKVEGADRWHDECTLERDHGGEHRTADGWGFTVSAPKAAAPRCYAVSRFGDRELMCQRVPDHEGNHGATRGGEAFTWPREAMPPKTTSCGGQTMREDGDGSVFVIECERGAGHPGRHLGAGIYFTA